MKLSANSVKELEYSEGKKYKAYKCSAKVWTIGIGTTVYPDGSKVKEGDSITDKQAYEYLAHDLAEFETQVKRLVQVPLTQNQFDALVLFTYNIGGGGLESSTLLKKLNNEDYDGAAKAFMLWDKITDVKTQKKVFSQGLHDRRKREMKLFLQQEEFDVNHYNVSYYSELSKYGSMYKPDPNNTPLRNRDLPIPTAFQEYGVDSVVESKSNLSDKQKITAITTTGVAGAGGVATVIADPQIISSAITIVQSLDYRVVIVLLIIGAIGFGVWWLRRGK